MSATTWEKVTGPGQVQVGDRLRFTIGDKVYNERAKLLLHAGTDKEEVIYNKSRNYYFITAMVMSGFSNHKNVEFLSIASAPVAAAPAAQAATVKTWRERMKTTGLTWKTGEGKLAVEIQYMEDEIADLRAALQQRPAPAPCAAGCQMNHTGDPQNDCGDCALVSARAQQAEAAPAPAELNLLRDMLAIQEACGLHTDEYAPGSVIEYIKELEVGQAEAAPVATAEPTYMTNEQAREWAWKAVREDVGTNGWTVGDSGNYYGFFLHGWNYRAQYEKQRDVAQGAPAPTAEPDGWIGVAIVAGEKTSVAFRDKQTARDMCVEGDPFPFWRSSAAAQTCIVEQVKAMQQQIANERDLQVKCALLDVMGELRDVVGQTEAAAPAAALPALELPPLPEQHEELRARWKCDSCDGRGHDGELHYQGEWQPPEPYPCGDCDGAGQVQIKAYTADQMSEYGKACASAARAMPAPNDAGDYFSPADMARIVVGIQPGDGWSGVDWDFALANAAAKELARRARAALAAAPLNAKQGGEA